MTSMTFLDLLKKTTPRPRVIAVIMTLLMAGNLLSLVNPWLAGQITSVILGDSKALPIGILLGSWITVLLSTNIINFIVNYRTAIEGEFKCAELRSDLNDHCQNLPVEHFYNTTTGDLLSYFTNDIENVGYFVTYSVLPILPTLLMLCGAFALMVQTSWLIALVTVLLMPCYYIAVKLISRNLRPISSQWMTAYADIVSLLEQRLGNITLIKIFSSPDVETRLFQEKNDRYVDLSRKQHLIQSAITPATSILAALGLIVVLWLGAHLISAGEITPAELVTLILYSNMMRSPLASLASLYGEYQQTRGAAERIVDLFNQPPEADDGGSISIETGQIRLRELSFGYDEPLLLEASTVINGGETVAIAGPNGSGKTTLAFLIMALIRPPVGQLFIDNQDISAVAPSNLRKQFSLVSQNTLLLNDTIAANIGISDNPGLQDIKKAAARVHADTFIEGLPDGYDTLIGNHGLRLSGGQRQKIALARAMLKDAPIILLDEPTSMFDMQAEQDFANDCKELFKDRTVLLITHSPRLLHLADRVLEIRDKKLVDRPL